MATFEQAMTKTSAGGREQQSRTVRAGAAIWSRSGVDARAGSRALGGYASGCSPHHGGVQRARARRAPLRAWRPGARRPKSSVMRCVRSVTIVAAEVMRARHDVGDDLGVGRDTAATARARRPPWPSRVPRRTVLPTTVGSLLSAVRPEAMRQHRRAGGVGPVVRRRRAGGRARGAGPSPRSTSRRRRPPAPRAARRSRPCVKSMVEKSPKALTVVDARLAGRRSRAPRRSCSRRRGRARSGGCRPGGPRRG